VARRSAWEQWTAKGVVWHVVYEGTRDKITKVLKYLRQSHKHLAGAMLEPDVQEGRTSYDFFLTKEAVTYMEDELGLEFNARGSFTVDSLETALTCASLKRIRMFGEGRIDLKNPKPRDVTEVAAERAVSIVEFTTNTAGDEDSLSRAFSGIEPIFKDKKRLDS
jgi:hypothetical protein